MEESRNIKKNKDSEKKEQGLEERIQLSLLYDFYGALLRENQQRIFEPYILDDYSISEIADELGITRQGVHDGIKRASKQLREYEEKLGLLVRFEQQKEAVKELHRRLFEKGVSQDSEWKEIFQQIEEIIEE